jgi:uncharacterized protein YjbJ (UPF0337 family)
MDWNEVAGKWTQVKGKFKQKWGQLTDDDLAVIDGKREQLEGKSRNATERPRIKPRARATSGSKKSISEQERWPTFGRRIRPSGHGLVRSLDAASQKIDLPVTYKKYCGPDRCSGHIRGIDTAQHFIEMLLDSPVAETRTAVQRIVVAH